MTLAQAGIRISPLTTQSGTNLHSVPSFARGLRPLRNASGFPLSHRLDGGQTLSIRVYSQPQTKRMFHYLRLWPSEHDRLRCTGIHGFAGGQVRTYQTVLGSTKMMAHGDFFAFSKYVQDHFLSVRKCLKFVAKKPHEVRAASDRGFTGSNTGPVTFLTYARTQL
jgi:hypothetical protein